MEGITWMGMYFSPLELLATVLAFVYVVLEVKGSIYLWVFGVLSGLAYTFVFGGAKLYASMGIQVYYVFAAVYGYFVWRKQELVGDEEIEIGNVPREQWAKLSVLLLLIVAGIYIILRLTDTPSAWGEAIVNGLSVLALWMLTKKYRQHWLMWIVVNMMATVLYYSEALYATAILYICFTGLSVLGWFVWRKKYKNQAIPDK